MNLFTRKDGLLALKPERQEVCKAAGVSVLGFAEKMPKGGILLVDTRPRAFVGGRGPDDPAATMIIIGSVFKPDKTYYFESFERALKKALKLAAGTTSATSA
ncbi:hypothetical protein GIW79_24735 [Pseudomonas sp. PA-7-1E]|uniref:hypothetical protein n=1 Tax=unclassified Pseudomonas TaxID=196821 RepID=UPI0003DDBC9C|nr:MULTISPECIES: hypothetical protein [unclassified Pseudomonas]ETK39472.1 hypothetical protein H098_21500 [Pseudomonas fluorescens FH5]MCF5043664.1 hypothetical protein [Pseudomonas sp. PA-7-1E]MCF5130894.1 hypothetical protein [Pseudomonas sp. PA-6-4F]WLH25845.1 hypothetical protein PSH76_08435 [Pseudomonas sp. FP215]